MGSSMREAARDAAESMLDMMLEGVVPKAARPEVIRETMVEAYDYSPEELFQTAEEIYNDMQGETA